MNIQLFQLILQREGEQLDFKRTINNSVKIAKTICAFANTNGGKLVVGINDDRTIYGIDPEEEKHILNQAAQFYCKPEINLQYEEIYYSDPETEEDEKTILVVNIAPSSQKPHFAQDTQGEWNAFIREHDKTVLAGKKMLNLLKVSYPEDNQAEPESKNEKRLLDYLRKYKRINLKQYADLVNISTRRARKELEAASEKGKIRIMEYEQESFYVI
jgi:predicted HTH transcriptional regulator